MPVHTPPGLWASESQHGARGTSVSGVIEIANYGGWSLIANVGANKGDKITLIFPDFGKDFEIAAELG